MKIIKTLWTLPQRKLGKGMCAAGVLLVMACAERETAQSHEPLTQELPASQQTNSWFKQGLNHVGSKRSTLGQNRQAKNVVLFVGDGMGVSTVTAARILQGQLNGHSGEENLLSFERFPYVGLSKTYNTDQQTPDSAGTMTAMMTGVKTRAGMIAISDASQRGECSANKHSDLVSALALAELVGKGTGIVTTARVTHATPAATYAHSAERDWESDDALPTGVGCQDIAQQLVNFAADLKQRFPERANKIDGLDVVLGGGRRHFLPRAENGKRQDGKNLIHAWQTQYPTGHYVQTREELLALTAVGSDAKDDALPAPLFGLFNTGHMRYEQDRNVHAQHEPSLKEMTLAALQRLQKKPDGFFLMVEAGRIDHGHHAGNAFNALHETIMLSDTVSAALQQINLADTLVIVTADHSHVMTMAGYPKRGNPILGKVVNPGSDEPALAADGMPYTTLGYMNGRGFADYGDETDTDAHKHDINTGRKNIAAVNTELPGYHQEALIPRHSETHGGEDVAIYAIGPGAEFVSGVNEQNVIFHVMAQALGWY